MNGAGGLLSLVAVCAGASIGAVLRWLLAVRLNPLLPALPLGTLAPTWWAATPSAWCWAGWGQHPEMPLQVRLFLVTGLLGGLTTFSTFSAEVVAHLLGDRIAWALLVAMAHLAGSLLLTAAGLATMRAWGHAL